MTTTERERVEALAEWFAQDSELVGIGPSVTRAADLRAILTALDTAEAECARLDKGWHEANMRTREVQSQLDTVWNTRAHPSPPEGGDKAVASATEEVAAWMIAHSYATGHGDTVADLLEELTWQLIGRQSPPPSRGWPTREEIAAIILESQPPKGFKHRHPNALEKAARILSLFTGGRG